MKRCDGAVGVAIVGRPALGDDFSAEQRVELLHDHACHCKPEIARQDKQAGAPCEVRVVVPEVARLEDRRVLRKIENDLQGDCNCNVDHAYLIGIGNDRGRLPAKVDNREVDADRIDHVVDDGLQNRAIGADDQREALKTDASRQGREECLLGLYAHGNSNDEDEYRNKDCCLECGEEQIQGIEKCIHSFPFCQIQTCCLQARAYFPSL